VIQAYSERACLRGSDRAARVRGLNAWYGESHILHGVAFDVAPGEVVTLSAATAPARRRP
jgi:branched-chain amino acid transport system ATP-binding protein